MVKQKNNSLILICGGSASGKTTLSSEIESIIREKGHSVSFVSVDEYYKNLDHLKIEERKEFNYDHPNSIEWKKLNDDITKLLSGIEIEIPKYNKEIYTHHKNKTIKIKSSDIIVLEGIFSLYDPELNKKAIVKVFVDTDSDIRLIRRIKRDIIDGNRDLGDLLINWEEEVKPMYETIISLTKGNADIIIPNTKIEKNSVAIDIIKTKIVSLIKD